MKSSSNTTTMKLTTFPCLFSTRDFTTSAGQIRRRIKLPISFNVDSLSHAWISLLSSYTGHSDVSFILDNSVISTLDGVTTSKQHISSEQLLSIDKRSTAIFLEEGSPSLDLALDLCYNSVTGLGFLRSRDHIPESFLVEIERFLLLGLQYFNNGRQLPIPVSYFSELSQSVANRHPIRLAGVDLLHNLINSWDDKYAIDYLAANGERRLLSYRDLQDTSGRLAASLCHILNDLASNLQPVVAILLPQSIDLYVSQLAVLKSGCAFVCINPKTPIDRLKFMLEDSSSSLLLTSSSFLDDVASVDIPCLGVDQISASKSTENPYLAYNVSPADTAYIMYTSGSTGLPKGVAVSHDAVTQSLLSHEEHIPSFRRFLQFAAPTFDVSIFEIYFTLSRGSTLVCCDRSTMLNDLVDVMNIMDVDAAELTPTVAGSLLRQRDDVPTLKLLLTIGEMLKDSVISEFGGSESNQSLLWAMYGPTEAAIHCTLEPAMSSRSNCGNIGKPLSTVSAYVVANHDETPSGGDIEVLPTGFVGELAIGGHQLAIGYLNRPEQTASVFINTTTACGRIYRTGDKARILPDGSIECLGRISSGQIKLRGQRIELGEIEHTALRASGCRNAVATVIASQLVLFCCADSKALVDQVAAECQRWLPSHMIPSEIVYLDSFPYLASGKVDKKQMEAGYEAALDPSEGLFVDPQDQFMTQICSIVGDVTGHTVSPASNLLAIGIDSLVVIRLASRFRQIKRTISPIEILACDRVSDLRSLLLEPQDEPITQDSGKLKGDIDLYSLALDIEPLQSIQETIQKIVKCTDTQIGMLTETAMDPTAYQNFIEIEIPDGVSMSDMHTWLRQLIEKHSMLRSGFIQTRSPHHPYLRIIWKEVYDYIVSDVSIIKREAIPFADLEFIPHPILFELFFSSLESNKLLIRAHHAAYDGWSIDLLMRELGVLKAMGTIPRREQFDIVQRHYDNVPKGEVLPRWQEYLDDCIPTILPGSSSSESHIDSPVSKNYQFSSTATELRALASRLRVSPQCFIQAATYLFIAKLTGYPDIVIETVTSGRTIPVEGIEDIFGPCLRTLPLRVNLSHSRVISNIVQQIHRLNRWLLSSSAASIQNIRKVTPIAPGVPLSDVLFIWQQTLDSNISDSNGFKVLDESNHVRSKLLLEIEPLGDAVSVKASVRNWDYQHDSLFQELDQILCIIVQSVDKPLENILPAIPGFPLESPTALPTQLDEQVSIETEWSTTESIIRDCVVEMTATLKSRIQKSVSLFRYGVDSIIAIQLARLLRQHGIDVSGVSIIQNPTIERLASEITSSTDNLKPCPLELPTFIPQTELLRINAVLAKKGIKVDTILPCTPLQEAMLSANLTTRTESYCNVMLFKLVGDSQKLLESCESVFQRHPIFQTIFIQTGIRDHPFVQGVLSNPVIHVDNDHIILGHDNLNPSIVVNEGGRLMSKLREKLAPPATLTIFNCQQGNYLRFICHHALYDASAIQSLIHEIECEYRGQSLSLEVSTESFLKVMADHRSEEAKSYWMDSLRGYRPTLILHDKSRPTSAPKRTLRSSLKRLQDICRSQSMTLGVLLEATFSKLLYQLLRAQDICFGTVVSGRNHAVENLDQLIFPTFNTIPLRVNLSTLSDNSSLFASLKDFHSKSEQYNLYPLRRLQREFASSSETRLFSMLLLIQQGPYILDRTIWELGLDAGTMEFPVVFEMIPDKLHDQIDVALHHFEGIFGLQEIQAIYDMFDTLLDLTSKYPASPCVDFASMIPTTHILPESILNRKSGSSEPASVSHIELPAEDQAIMDIITQFSEVPQDQISMGTTIYRLGIDSLRAIQLATRLSQELNQIVIAADILAHPRIDELISFLMSIKDKRKDQRPLSSEYRFAEFESVHIHSIGSELNVPIADIERIRPCTPMQTGLISQFITSGSTYVNFLSFAVDEDLDVDGMRIALLTAAARNPILRTGFSPINDKDHAFAMITYKQPYTTQVSAATPRYCSPEYLRQWRKDKAQQFHRSLHQPPWSALLLPMKDQVQVHLAVFHALYDAHSLQSLLQEVLDLHRGIKTSNPVEIDPIIEHILHSSQATETREFWKSHMGEGLVRESSTSKFPDMTPNRVQSRIKNVEERKCSFSVTDLEKLCESAGITLQAAGQATWAQILSSYSVESVVTFGTVLSGRDSLPGSEDVMFPSIVTLPIVVNVVPNLSKLLTDILKFNTEVRPHQFASLVDIARWSGKSKEVMFDTIFSFQRSASRMNETDWKIIGEEASDEYSVAIELEPDHAGALIIRVTHDCSRLPQGQARILLDQFNSVLCHIARSLDYQPSDLPTSILSIMPPSRSELPSPVNLLHQFVDMTANTISDAPALEFVTGVSSSDVESRIWTYSQLQVESTKIAAYLQSERIKSKTIVGICFEKCPEASFATIGILKAGCGYVALDPGAPIARKKYIIDDSNCNIVLTARRGSIDFGKAKELEHIKLIYLDELDLSSSRVFQEPDVQPSDLCYCLYTSGTTGNPKGCEITHENAVQAMRAFSIQFNNRWDSNSKWLQFASFHFDVSVLEQFWSWSEGICVVSASRDLMLQDLPGFIRSVQITHLDLTPSLAILLRPDDVPSLCKGVFITGGESLRQDILNTWGSKEVIHNGYGPTEATIGVTMYPRVPANGKPSNIGKQFDNVGTYVLQPDTEKPVLRGGVGELCISGKLVGKGYLNNPILTNQKFPIIQPFNERVYRTGDLVRLLYDGSFEFLGRSDDQVKLRGQRLEIGEIDSTIKSVTGVINVATLVLLHPKQQKKQLVSFVLVGPERKQPEIIVNSTEDSKQIITKVCEQCRDHLPPYMIPTFVIPVTQLPLTANNKVDRQRLRLFFESLSIADIQAMNSQSLDSNEMNSFEKSICSVFLHCFGIQDEGIFANSNFFELGMDSISVIRYVRELEKEGHGKVSPSLVMLNSSFRGLSKAMKASQSKDDTLGPVLAIQQRITALSLRHKSDIAAKLQVEAHSIESIAPCTPLQEGMIVDGLGYQQNDYFVTFQMLLVESIDIGKLRHAWELAYQQIQILRARFVRTDDGYIQATVRNSNLTWTQQEIASDQIQREVVRFREVWIMDNEEHIRSPLSLLLLKAQSSTVLSLNIFHGLYDGISLPKLLDHVRKVYEDQSINYTHPQFNDALPYGPLLLSPFSKQFWTEKLCGDWKNLDQIPSQTNSIPISVTRELRVADDIEKIKRKLNVTHQSIIQTCWAATLSNIYHGSVCLGLVTSGRTFNWPGFEEVVGPLFNTILFQPKWDQNDTWSSLVKRVHDYNLEVLPYQHTPLRDVFKWVSVGAKRKLRIDNLLTFQILQESDNEWKSNQMWQIVDKPSQLLFPIACEAELHLGKSLKVFIGANSSFFDKDMINSIIDRFEALLTNILFHTEDKVELGEISNSPAHDLSTQNDKEIIERFVWDEPALTIRREIADLAGLDAQAITERQSIFELGLDSIDAIKVTSRLAKKDIHIKMSSMMQNPTISMMRSLMSKMDSRNADTERSLLKDFETNHASFVQIPIDSRKMVQSILPATPLQEAMYSDMVASDFKRYFNHDVLKLRADVEISTLIKAWETIVAANRILRTAFTEYADGSTNLNYVQVIFNSVQLSISQIDLPSIDSLKEVFDRVCSSARASVLSPMTYLTVATVANDKYLVLSLPHALYDGVSLQLIHEDVEKAYRGLALSHPVEAVALEKVLRGSGDDAALFWKSRLSQCNSCLLPSNVDLPMDYKSIVHRKELASRVSISSLKQFIRNEGITLHQLTLTCFALLIASYCRTLEPSFALVLSGRDTEESQNVVFPLMNTVIFQSVVHGTYYDMIQQTQHELSNILAHQYFPLKKAVSYTDRNKGTMVDTMFMFLGKSGPRDADNAPLYQSVTSQSEVEFNFCVEAEVMERNLIWRNACKSTVLHESDAQILLEKLDELLSTIISNKSSACYRYDEGTVKIASMPSFRREQDRSAEPVSLDDETLDWDKGREQIVRLSLAEIAGVPETNISLSTSIFYLGLDSISAIKVSTLLLKRGLKIGVSTMMRDPTLAGISKNVTVIDNDQNTTTSERSRYSLPEALMSTSINKLSAMDMDLSSVEAILPVSAGQAYFLSTWKVSCGALFYGTFKYQITGQTSKHLIQAAWRQVVRSNSILRTMFLSTNHELVPYLQVRMKSTLGRVFFGDEATEAGKDKAQPFALLSAQKHKDDWLLSLKIHHALYDGVSLERILNDFQAKLSLSVDTSSSRCPAWDDNLLKLAQPEGLDQAKKFWVEYLRDIPNRRAATDIPTARFEIYRPKTAVRTEELVNVSKANEVSIQALVLSSYAKAYATNVLKSLPLDSDIVIGIYMANRSYDMEGILSTTMPTVNMVLVRIKNVLSSSIKMIAKQIQADLRDISTVENSSVTLDRINDWTGVKVDTFFNFLSLPTEATSHRDGIVVQELRESAESPREELVETPEIGFVIPQELQDNMPSDAYGYTIDMEVAIRGGGLDVGLFGPTSMMTLPKAQSMMDEFLGLLTSIIEKQTQ